MWRRLRLKLGIMVELFSFLWKRKLFWMIPLVIVILILGLLAIFAQSSPLAPFIYPLF